MRFIVRFLGFLFAAGTVVFLVGVAAAAGLIWHFSKDLPDYSQLQDYEPPVMTRVHATDGSLVGEYAKERRLYLPIQAVPKLVINAFLAAEDKNFYEHGGIDYTGMARAGVVFLQNFGSNRRPQGASTITQQVAKNFLLTNEVSFTRKIKEALLAMRIERAYSKDKILELYLNEIYLGSGAYGVAAASLVYFDKSVNELTVAEAAYLAALPKMPGSLHPIRNHDRAVERRNYVVDRLQENGWISKADAEKARKDQLTVAARNNGAHTFAGEYFAEEVRRDIFERYGEKKLYEGGLSVRTTLDPKIQVMARKAMVAGLVKYDEEQGYRGPVSKLDVSGDWGIKLAEIKSLSDISPWRMAVVLETSDQSARIGFQPARELGGNVSKERQTGLITLDGVRWARAASGNSRGKSPSSVAQVLQPGDVIYADPLFKEGNPVEGQYRLEQLPEVSGAMVAMDPNTGRVLAMVGGFSFDQSQFNRATQAYRQPGSSFKPIVYSSALDNGYTPSSQVVDAPIEVDPGQGGTVWRPDNFSNGKYLGPTTLRNALRLSLNTVTVRLGRAAELSVLCARRRRDHGDADGHGLFDDRQWRPPREADLDRPHPGSLRPHHLQARCAGVPGLRRAEWLAESGRAAACGSSRTGARHHDRLPDHLDAGRRRQCGYRHRAERGRQADRRQDRHHQRGQGRLVRRLLARSRGRDLHGLRQAAAARPWQRGDRRPSGGADRARFHEARARRQAGDTVQDPGRHQAGARRFQDRHARRPRFRPYHHGSLQARHGAAGQLLGHRRG
jgi:penicillin-binding protein 1A